jgi:5-methylcytosine-specific restriction endonuclease McrA
VVSPRLTERLAALRRRSVHDPHNADVRDVVRLRANDACEYCLLPTTLKFEIEHIIPADRWADYKSNRLPGLTARLGRQGPHHIDNYAWACPFCNRAKGGRVSHRSGRRAVRFFDPRHDRWPIHFIFPAAVGYLVIAGLTPIGRVTAGPEGLDLNAGGLEGPLVTRHLAIMRGEYPPQWACLAYGI